MRFHLADVQAALCAELVEAGVTETTERLAQAMLISSLTHQPFSDILADALGDLRRAQTASRRPSSLPGPSGSAVMVDCAGLPVYAASDLIVGSAAALAREHGVGIVGISRSGGMRSLDVWARMVAEEGAVALLTWSGGSRLVLPAGGIEPLFGTNPLAFAIPTSGHPIVADMATSQAAFKSVRAALTAGTPLPHGTGLDARGNPTVEPAEVIDGDTARILPIGGDKGSALVLLVEVLSGALVGCAMGWGLTRGHTPEEYGGMLLVVRPDLFVSRERFITEVDKLAADLRGSAPIVPERPVRLPGDRGVGAWEAARSEGIDIASVSVQRWLHGHGCVAM